VKRLPAASADPWLVSIGVLLAGVATGFGAMVLAWRGAAARTSVADQLPYVVSGAMGGLALVVFSLAALVVQVRRRAEAVRRADLGRVRAAVLDLAAEVRAETGSGR
jgi:membrane protein implicated in regulation of membrane protease activity